MALTNIYIYTTRIPVRPSSIILLGAELVVEIAYLFDVAKGEAST